MKHPGRGGMCTHGLCDSLTPGTALCWGEYPGSSPCCVPAGALAALPGRRFISAHANNLEVSPGVGQLVPGRLLGAFFMCPYKYPGNVFWARQQGPWQGPGAASRWLKLCQLKLSSSRAFFCPEQRTNVASIIDLFRDSPFLAWQEKTKRSFNLSKWFETRLIKLIDKWRFSLSFNYTVISTGWTCIVVAFGFFHLR